MLKTNREFKNEEDLNKYIIKYSQIVDRPASETRPIVNAILPEDQELILYMVNIYLYMDLHLQSENSLQNH